jgi:hypothetical protein
MGRPDEGDEGTVCQVSTGLWARPRLTRTFEPDMELTKGRVLRSQLLV